MRWTSFILSAALSVPAIAGGPSSFDEELQKAMTLCKGHVVEIQYVDIPVLFTNADAWVVMTFDPLDPLGVLSMAPLQQPWMETFLKGVERVDRDIALAGIGAYNFRSRGPTALKVALDDLNLTEALYGPYHPYTVEKRDAYCRLVKSTLERSATLKDRTRERQKEQKHGSLKVPSKGHWWWPFARRSGS